MDGSPPNQLSSNYSQPVFKIKYLVWGLVVFTLGIVLLQFSRYGFIEVTATNANAPLTYEIRNQADQKVTKIETSDRSVKKLLPKGNYEVTVKSGENSSFNVAHTGGFFGSTTVSSKLAPEKQRQFVGNNPGGCMFYVGQTLYSHGCAGSAAEMTEHVPAKASQPTYTLTRTTGIGGTIAGSVTLNDSEILLVKAIESEDTSKPAYSFYVLGSGLKIKNIVSLSGLDNSLSYGLLASGDGLVVYSKDFSQVLYYESVGSQPKQVSLGKPKNGSLQPFIFSSANKTLLAQYSDKASFEDQDNPRSIGVINTSSFITTDGKTRNINLSEKYNNQIISSLPCAANRLCILAGKTITVYDISGDKPSVAYRLTDANSMYMSGPRLLVVRDYGILSLDPNNGAGYIDYSLGNYSYCGLRLEQTDYLLCLTNSKNKNVAIRVSQQTNNDFSIDKKIDRLLDHENISDVSAYKNYIYITPNLGDQVYDQATNSYGYDTTTKRMVNNSIAAAARELKLPSNYVVINTIP